MLSNRVVKRHRLAIVAQTNGAVRHAVAFHRTHIERPNVIRHARESRPAGSSTLQFWDGTGIFARRRLVGQECWQQLQSVYHNIAISRRIRNRDNNLVALRQIVGSKRNKEPVDRWGFSLIHGDFRNSTRDTDRDRNVGRSIRMRRVGQTNFVQPVRRSCELPPERLFSFLRITIVQVIRAYIFGG